MEEILNIDRMPAPFGGRNPFIVARIMNTMETFILSLETNLPVNLILCTLQSSKFKPAHLRTYLYIKLQYGDRFTYSKLFREQLAAAMKNDVKTVKSHFKKLKELNLIGLNEKTNEVYVRSKYDIIPRQGDSSISVRVNLDHLKNFNAFLVAAMVGHRTRIIAHRKRSGDMPDLLNRGSLQGLFQTPKFLKGFHPLALAYLSAAMNRSKSWVDRYKSQAIKLGYIVRKHDRLNTSYKWKERVYLDDEIRGRVRKNGDNLSIVGIDLLFSTLSYRRKKSGRKRTVHILP